eukprot:CAMPEP_0196765422 /NCGR_PEP_ID=MMETSP1095-20130614/8689_1 /TAXON_ID=96789 ORGANISM="Chromulina nebulosa, Strain UTEXLB2642" /NCGR_SAMPLE_ID=MMETSP1095 /ASSEMBLY_ACC=CAM_ASM_000446 /LENGTH=174 /DNA_ID=CAMNT_0042123421 /DNA_START=123 /DNA_END=647 /DNA_ORIENTATION=+
MKMNFNQDMESNHSPKLPDSYRRNISKQIPAFLGTILALTTAVVNAEETTTTPVVVEKVSLGPPPNDFGLKLDYYVDAQKLVNQMRYAVQLEKGDPIIASFAQKVKDDMTQFVSYYRRNNAVSGKQSFSLLYTSINVLAGHYTSYGTKFPVPEKRRKRLLQEFADIDKNIRKKR